MIDERIRSYSAMWTSDLHKYGLVEFDPDRVEMCLIFDLDAWAPFAMDDDAEVVAAVIENMRRAGVRRLSPEEAKPR
jgi:hypothetical protein